MRNSLLGAVALALAALAPAASIALEPVIPNFWDTNERLPKPDLSQLPRLRFLTTIDFPPFSYLDEAGRITGFHVDLARAICDELGILDRCQIQGLPWEELDATLRRGDGDAIIAGIAATAENREKYAFSRAYLQFPARFVMPKTSAVSEPIYAKVAGKRIGVVAGSAHERMLRDYFPEVKPVTYSKREWLFRDLKDQKLDGAFGDGMRLGFWLSGAGSAGCCRYAGGPYLAPEYLGNGLAIAAPADRPELAAAFDFALRELNANGVFAELYLRHFPVSFF